MRQKINGGLNCTMDESCQDAAPRSNLAPAAFSTNQNGTLCLPLMSENRKIIWVRSDQINIPLDKIAELDNAFSRFPYLTQRQTISLAQCCSLHPDQVKVWFMTQRLCYGISWDSKDILKMRRKMLGQAKRKQHNIECEVASQTKTKDAKENKRGRTKIARTHPSREVARKGQLIWPNTETAQPPNGANSDRLFASCSKPDLTSLQKTNGEHTFAIQDDCLDKSPSLIFQPQVAQTQTLPIKELKTTNLLPSLVSSATRELQTKRHELITRLNWKRKTPRQLALLKVEFAKYQYPNDIQYKQMSVSTGIPRNVLVQWFRDMRYLIKNAKPGWLTANQHRRAVANVVREQCDRGLRKLERRAKREKKEPCSNNLALDVKQ